MDGEILGVTSQVDIYANRDSTIYRPHCMFTRLKTILFFSRDQTVRYIDWRQSVEDKAGKAMD